MNMVDITVHEDTAIFDIKGFHKVWAFKKLLKIPVKHIVGVHHAAHRKKEFWKGWRVIGTHIPGVIAAGTFKHEGKTIFWDTSRGDNTIVVELANEHYDELVIDVDDPARVVQSLQAGIHEVRVSRP